MSSFFQSFSALTFCACLAIDKKTAHEMFSKLAPDDTNTESMDPDNSQESSSEEVENPSITVERPLVVEAIDSNVVEVLEDFGNTTTVTADPLLSENASESVENFESSEAADEVEPLGSKISGEVEEEVRTKIFAVAKNEKLNSNDVIKLSKSINLTLSELGNGVVIGESDVREILDVNKTKLFSSSSSGFQLKQSQKIFAAPLAIIVYVLNVKR